MNINEALAARLPLPWKQSTCDGPPIWKVERQRPEDFTAEIYQKLKKYGMKEDEIRNLFYIQNADYATLKKQVGAVPADDEDEPKAKPKKQYKNCFPNAKKIAPEPITAEDADGLNYQDRHNLGIHAPTDAEKEDLFRPEDDQPIPFVPVDRSEGCHDFLKQATQAEYAKLRQQQREYLQKFSAQMRRGEPVPEQAVETAQKTLEFTDGPSGSSAKLTEFKLPPVPSAKIQITCHGYSLKQLKAFLFAMPDDTAISGVIHISLRGSESNHGT